MKSRTFKVVVLFFIMGLGSGLLSIFIGSLSVVWMWLGVGAILLLGLLLSIIIARRLGWLSLVWSGPRSFFAALIIVVAYPISELVMIGGSILYGRLYEILFSISAQERLSIGDNPSGREGFFIGLALAAVVSAVLVSLALKVLTRKWDKGVMFVLITAGLVTIPLSQAIAALIGELNWHLVLFPVGEAFFSTLCGYWLLRAGPVQEQAVSSPATASQPHQRPA